MSPIEQALRELVALKDLKERIESLHKRGPWTDEALDQDKIDRAEYARRKPIAWANARAALSALEAPQPVGRSHRRSNAMNGSDNSGAPEELGSSGLRTESGAAAGLQGAASAFESLFAIANELHGEFDKQTCDEHRRADWDTPEDAELCVTITAKQERALSKAILAVEQLKYPAMPEPRLWWGFSASKTPLYDIQQVHAAIDAARGGTNADAGVPVGDQIKPLAHSVQDAPKGEAAQPPHSSGQDQDARDAARWVSVDERLPEKFTEVLIAFAGQIAIAATGQYTASVHDKHGWCYPSENNGTCDDGSDPIVTHWMPLPDAPAAMAQPKDTP